MEKYIQEVDLTLFGIRVETFPRGIKESFERLAQVFGLNRAYYGLSWFAEDGEIIYYAMLAEAFNDEGKQCTYEQITLTKGEYLTSTIFDWMGKTDCIKDIFHTLLADAIPTKTRPCVEWYKSVDEMRCMVKMK